MYKARHAGRAVFATVQHHYNPVWREDERELVPFARTEGLGLLPYSPVARGFLAGAARRQAKSTERARTDEYAWQWYGRPEDEAVAEQVEAAARKQGVSPAQAAIAWVLQSSAGAVPIVGCTSVPQLEQAVAAVSTTLDPQDMAAIGAAYRPRPRGGH